MFLGADRRDRCVIAEIHVMCVCAEQFGEKQGPVRARSGERDDGR